MSNIQKKIQSIPFSVLDLSPITEGGSATVSFQNTIDLAQHVEAWGYNRYWLAEHHNMPFIASSATSLLIGHVAGNTNSIRVGSGGIMLPNHAPLVVAEQFGTLETLYPGRIDLGLGRAPGTDGVTAQALRRELQSDGQDFPRLLNELRSYFNPSLSSGKQNVRAIPGTGLNVPIWLLGSSGFSAQLSAQLGLPFAYASHFSPNNTLAALDLYRNQFQPSESMESPHAMLGVNIIAADTDEEAERLATSLYQQFLNLIRSTELPLQPPVESIEEVASEREIMALRQQLGSSIIGSKESVREQLQSFIDKTQADELMVISQIYDHEARIRSYEIVAELFKEAS
ncbi:MAG: LLM class flavin-dependent oxidoreductase [Halobacillus sp.]|uniref:LLM class flavin-dependent oxidoreductase n=2 Tax=Halobacillus sp. TaxID=56800 RepID=UPI003BAEA43E